MNNSKTKDSTAKTEQQLRLMKHCYYLGIRAGHEKRGKNNCPKLKRSYKVAWFCGYRNATNITAFNRIFDYKNDVRHIGIKMIVQS